MATLKEIARMAGVSPATRIPGCSTRTPALSVTEDTRQRVLQAAQEVGYQTVQQRYQAAHQREETEPPIWEKRIGIAQMFETQQLLEDIYYPDAEKRAG